MYIIAVIVEATHIGSKERINPCVDTDGECHDPIDLSLRDCSVLRDTIRMEDVSGPRSLELELSASALVIV